MVTNVSVKHERVLGEVQRLCSENLGGPELLYGIAESLRRAILFDAYVASTMDPATGLITHLVAEGLDLERGTEDISLDQVYFEEDLDQLSSMLRERRSVQLLSETTGGNLERSLRYRDFLKPLGFRHELGGAFIDGGLWGGIDLIREAGTPDFTRQEVRLLGTLAPHVGPALKTATLRSGASTTPVTDYTPGVLTLDRGGRVLSHNLPARRLLSELDERDPFSEDNLPVVVRMVASAVRLSSDPESGRGPDLVPKVRVRATSGHWFTLHGSPTEFTSGRPAETVIVIEHSRPQEIARLNSAAYGLTSREKEITGLVAQGFSTRQISGNLFISEYTVQRHLQNTFEKVGVRSRGELLKSLFSTI
ncbi:MAG: LuxR C-terminal-related transcriptional regulator [Rubrobacteraceae bacterium]